MWLATLSDCNMGVGARLGEYYAADENPEVQKRCKAAGLAGSDAAHSLRSGFVSEALRAGVTPLEAIRMTGHKDVRTLQRYHRASDSMSATLRAVVAG